MVDEGVLDKQRGSKAMQWVVRHYENRDIQLVLSVALLLLLTAYSYMGSLDSASLCQALCEAKGNDNWQFSSSILSNQNGCYCGAFNPSKAAAICHNLTQTQEYWPGLDPTKNFSGATS